MLFWPLLSHKQTLHGSAEQPLTILTAPMPLYGSENTEESQAEITTDAGAEVAIT